MGGSPASGGGEDEGCTQSGRSGSSAFWLFLLAIGVVWRRR
jgi:MYXO-CTERM domain-containing protein